MVVLLAMLVGACGADDRELRPPSPDQTTTSTAPPGSETAPSDAVGTDTELTMGLSSAAFSNGGQIPDRYTCRAEDVSPPLAWTNLPAGTVELALVVRDPDAAGFVHWVVTGISPAAGGFVEGQVPEGAIEASNDFGRPGWGGPCPPDGTHTYELTLYALSGSPAVVAGMDAQEARIAVEMSRIVASATLTGTVTAP